MKQGMGGRRWSCHGSKEQTELKSAHFSLLGVFLQFFDQADSRCIPSLHIANSYGNIQSDSHCNP